MSRKIILLAVAAGAVILAAALIVMFINKTPGGEPAIFSPSPSQSPSSTREMFVALGSSLTRATNLSSNMQGENDEYGFSTGTKIPSVYAFLKKEKSDLTRVNLASPGAGMKDILERQLPEALKSDPKYVTLDPAADIVTTNSIPQYRANLTAMLDRIGSDRTIMMFTYPNFVKMRTANYQPCKENKVGVNLSSLTAENILAFNQTIKEVAGNRRNVILIDIYDLLGPGDVSDYDCLHVNIEGQKKIAAEFIKRLGLP